MFLEDKIHLKDCPSERVDKTPAMNVNISLKLDVEELEVNDNDPLEADVWNPTS